MSTEIATVDGEIVEQRAPMTLFGTDDPTAVVDRASAVATALAGVISERQLFKRIRDRDHIYVEGWTLLGSMLGVFAEVEWSRPVENGWEARAVARTLSGSIVGAAEAMCTKSEATWKDREDHAVRSMAQTRAVSKALRLPLGFIIELAGYSATPAEEMTAEDQPERVRGGSPSSPNAPAPVQYRRGELAVLMVEHNLDNEAVLTVADRIGIPKDERPMSDESMDRLIEAIETSGQSADAAHAAGATVPATDTPQSDRSGSDAATAPDSEDEGGFPPATSSGSGPAPTLDDVLAASGGELIPPKPGTDPYRALPAQEKAEARAYWQKAEAAA